MNGLFSYFGLKARAGRAERYSDTLELLCHDFPRIVGCWIPY
jgi:hypothetical protein